MSAILLIAACAQINTKEGAPFELKGKSVLFVGDGNDDNGAGAFVITDDSLGCDEIPPVASDVFDDRVQAGGAGLVLTVTYALAAGLTEPWPGTYATTGTDRVLDPLAWRGSEILDVDPSGAFVEIEKFDDKRAVATFETVWWTGKVKAEVCDLEQEIECTPANAEQYINMLAIKACQEWDTCSDEPCTFSVSGTCIAFDAAAAAECLCVPWVCQDDNAGFEFVEIPAACALVCASN